MPIPRAIRERRARFLSRQMEAGGFTRASLAQEMGLDHSYISRLVSGHRTPSLEVAVVLAQKFHLPLAELAEVLVGR